VFTHYNVNYEVSVYSPKIKIIISHGISLSTYRERCLNNRSSKTLGELISLK